LDKVIQNVADAKENNMEVDSNDFAQDNLSKTIERNTGIKFPGSSFEMMKKFEIDDVELSSKDTLVVERMSKMTGKFIFYYEETKILGYGK
jgi:hypothetical protein